MSRFLLALLLLSFAVPIASAGEKKTRKPNVIVIVADDLGWADLGCQGCKDVPTPNIDSLAKDGTRCTNGYVSCPVCSPTRAGLMTGRYQQRFGHEFNPGPAQKAEANFGLPLNQTTIADLMRRLGYRTGLVGKWHLGYSDKHHPLERGFDEYFGFLGGAHSYIDAKADGNNPILRGRKPVDEKEYLTDAFTREAVAFIDKHHKDPFFLMVTYNGVHGPMQEAPEKYRKQFAKIPDEKRRTMAGMLTALDHGVGAILAKLKERGLDEDTLIVFISDNGGITPVNASLNTPLRGLKGTVWEGGVRVPFLVQWKAGLPAGKTYDHPVIALDILPTTVHAAGGKVPDKLDFDGVSLLPHLNGTVKEAPHDFLFWRFGAQWSVRKGDWKLVKTPSEEPQLFDLAKDISQTKDLAKANPDVMKELLAAYKKWDSELMPPAWKAQKAKKMKEVVAPAPVVQDDKTPPLLIVSKRTGNAEIFLVNAKGQGARNLTKSKSENSYPCWAPDGKRIAFASDRDGAMNIYVMDADGSNVKQVTKGTDRSRGPAWSPDGKKILFSRSVGERGCGIYLTDVEGGDVKRLDDEDGWNPAWSPDRKKILFASLRSGQGFRIYEMNADGKNVKALTSNDNNFGSVYPCYSPDGKKIMWSDAAGDGLEIFVASADGSNVKQMTSLGGYNTFAIWSADGKSIVFHHMPDYENGPLYIMDSDGKNRRVLLQDENLTKGARPAWRSK